MQEVTGFKGELITTPKCSLIALFIDLIPDWECSGFMHPLAKLPRISIFV